MSRRAFFASGALACATVWTLPAFGAEDVPLGPVPAPRIELGTMFGFVGVTALKVNGREQHDVIGEDVLGGMGAVSVNYSQGLIPHLGYLVVGNCGSEATPWAEERRERRVRCDLGVGPEVWIFPGTHGAHLDMRLGVPIGPTLGWINPHHTFGATEAFTTGTGWFLGVVTGVDAFWGHHGAYLDLTYARHVTSFTRSTTLLSDVSVRSTDHYSFEQSSLAAGLGYAYRF